MCFNDFYLIFYRIIHNFNLFDLISGLPMLFHHLCSILGMTVGTVTGQYGTEMIATIFGSEITNPILQFRWFLREEGKYNSVLGEIVDASFMFLFGFFRIGIGSYLLYSYFKQDTDFLGRLGAVVIYGISWMFWINIVTFAIKKHKRTPKHKRMHKQDSKNNVSLSNGEPHSCISNGRKSVETRSSINGSITNKDQFHIQRFINYKYSNN